MKEFKKIFVMLLSVSVLAGVMTFSCGAATGSDSYVEQKLGYTITYELNLFDYGASASIVADRIHGSVISPIEELEIQGAVSYYDSKGELVSKGFTAKTTSVSNASPCTVGTTTDRITKQVAALYYLNYAHVITLSV